MKFYSTAVKRTAGAPLQGPRMRHESPNSCAKVPGASARAGRRAEQRGRREGLRAACSGWWWARGPGERPSTTRGREPGTRSRSVTPSPGFTSPPDMAAGLPARAHHGAHRHHPASRPRGGLRLAPWRLGMSKRSGRQRGVSVASPVKEPGGVGERGEAHAPAAESSSSAHVSGRPAEGPRRPRGAPRTRSGCARARASPGGTSTGRAGPSGTARPTARRPRRGRPPEQARETAARVPTRSREQPRRSRGRAGARAGGRSSVRCRQSPAPKSTARQGPCSSRAGQPLDQGRALRRCGRAGRPAAWRRH